MELLEKVCEKFDLQPRGSACFVYPFLPLSYSCSSQFIPFHHLPGLGNPHITHTGEHSAAEGGKFDISNKQRIGFSEVELVQKMIDGVSKLIEFEERMAAGATTADIENLIELI